mgnify:CR=1
MVRKTKLIVDKESVVDAIDEGLEDVKKGWVSKVYDDVDEMKEDLDL